MTTEAQPIDPLIYARRWKTLAVLALSLVIIGLDNTILNVALPSLQQHFHASISSLQWIVDAYLLAFAGLLLTMGTLGDRFGRKKALLSGMLLFGGASLAVLLVQSAGQLIAVRAVMGAGAALIMPATLSIITNVFPREERAKAIAIWAGMAAVGIGLGPLFGGLLLHWFSWSSVFLVNVPVAVVALILGFKLVPDSRDPKPGAFDVPGAVLSVAALVTLVYAIIEVPPKGWHDPIVLGAFGAALVLAWAFVSWELHTSDPMLNLDFFRSARFTIGSFAISVAFFSLLGSIFGVTQYLQLAHGYSALQAGAAMAPLAVGLVAGAGSSVKLAARIGTPNVVASGLAALGGILASSLLWTPHLPYLPLGLWFFGAAVAMGWIMGPATDSVMGAVPPAKAGVASAMNDVSRQVAGALGTAIIGSLVASLYASRLTGRLGQALPADARHSAEDSIGAAHVVASRLPGSQATHLIATSGRAYTDALGIGLSVAAVVAVSAAIVVKRRLPADHLPVAAIADHRDHVALTTTRAAAAKSQSS
jgi:EmrB/QacA subfamily drug resistance transporter